MKKHNRRWLVILWLITLSTSFCKSSAQSQESPFDVYLKLFSPLALPIESFVSPSLSAKAPNIPSSLVEQFIDPRHDADNTWYESLGKIEHPGNNSLLLVRGESVKPDVKYLLLLVYNPQGLLLQKLTLEYNVRLRNTLKGSINKQLHIKLTSGSVNFADGKYSKQEYPFQVNSKGLIEAVSKDHMGFLKDMTQVMQYCATIKEYYRCLGRQDYKDISQYFSPTVIQWLGLKQVARDKIGQEAHRFLSNKKFVFFNPDFTQATIDGNTLKVPVKLGWNSYQAKVMAYFTFNERFEIVRLLEQSQ